MTAERLSALDASFLAVESDGRADARRLGVDLRPARGRPAPALPRAVRAPRRRASRTRRAGGRSSRPVPLGMHEPAWVDDPDFDPAEHLLHARGSRPRRDRRRDLLRRRSRATGRCGSSGSPTSCPTDSVAMIGKAHHCMVDGIAIVELGKLILDAEPYEERPEAEAWEPVPAPSRGSGFVRAVADRAADGAALVLAPVKLGERRPRRRARRARPRPHPRAHAAPARARESALNRAGSPRRHHVRMTRSLDELRDDPAALRRHAQRRRARRLRGRAARASPGPQRLKVMVPADVRGAGDAEDGNRISFVFLELPCDEPDPVARLRAGPRRDLAARRRRRGRGPRRGVPARSRSRPTPSSTCSPTRSRTRACRTSRSRASPARRSRATCSAASCADVHSAVPLTERHALSIGVVMIAGRVCFGIYADAETLPDADGLRERPRRRVRRAAQRCCRALTRSPRGPAIRAVNSRRPTSSAPNSTASSRRCGGRS